MPVREEALKAIGTRSLAIDVYIWLAYRLHCLTKPTPITWLAIHAQFGAGFRMVRQIKPTFVEALQLALAVYPEARVDIEPNGIVLHPSLPAIARPEARRHRAMKVDSTDAPAFPWGGWGRAIEFGWRNPRD